MAPGPAQEPAAAAADAAACAVEPPAAAAAPAALAADSVPELQAEAGAVVDQEEAEPTPLPEAEAQVVPEAEAELESGAGTVAEAEDAQQDGEPAPAPEVEAEAEPAHVARAWAADGSAGGSVPAPAPGDVVVGSDERDGASGNAPNSDALGAARRGLVGQGALVPTALGERAAVYCDWAAHGRALRGVERRVLDCVLPTLANTHTTTSAAGLQTTCFREEARGAIARATNCRVQRADRHADVVLFAGRGATGAANKLVGALGLLAPLPEGTPDSKRAVVLVGPHEHHSNLLPWRESSALVVSVPEDARGGVDRAALARLLERYAPVHPLVIGAFAAASNVTGIEADVDGISEQLHRAGALAVWDYAAAAPFAPLDMNPVVMMADGSGANPYVYKDAALVSTHKMAGGAGAPGVLLAKRRLFSLAAAPSTPGGGTVFFVTSTDHRYLSNREEREEGGTPDVVGAARAGLAFAARADMLRAGGHARDRAIAARVDGALRATPRLAVLGPTAADVPRLAAVSFLVEAPAPSVEGHAGGASGTAPARAAVREGLYLHYNFVCALLNDAFGVQCRGGCACAGPYGLELLGVTPSAAAALEAQLLDKQEVLRPGFTRLSFAPMMADFEVEYAIECVRVVAECGWRALPQYRFDTRTGECRHASWARSFPKRRWLAHMRWEDEGGGQSESHDARDRTSVAFVDGGEEGLRGRLEAQLAEGVAWLRSLGGPEDAVRAHLAEGLNAGLEGEAERLRWFMLPGEAAALMGGTACPRATAASADAVPVRVREYASDASIEAEAPDASFEPADAPAEEGDDVFCDALEDAATVEARDEAPIAPPARSEPRDAQPLPVGEGPARAASRKHALQGGGGGGAGARAPAYVALGESLKKEAKAEAEAEAEACARGDGGNQADGGSRAEGATDGSHAGSRLSAKQLRRRKAAGPFVTPPPKVMKSLAKANAHWGMIQPGDKVLLGLSGGKDSLALLHCLAAYQRRFPPGSWSFAVATVDPGTDAFNPRPLIPYVESLGLTYHYLENPIMQWAADGHMQGDSICAFCSRMKRGALYSCCREHGYNKLALAQHLDDQAESFLMSTLHNGKLRVMKASYTIDAGDIDVIRPFVYVRERALRDFSYAAGLPVIADNCPACFEEPKERHSVKKLLQKEEAVFPSVYSCILRAMTPVMDPLVQDVLASVSADLDARAGEKAARAKAADPLHQARLRAGGKRALQAAKRAEDNVRGNGVRAHGKGNGARANGDGTHANGNVAHANGNGVCANGNGVCANGNGSGVLANGVHPNGSKAADAADADPDAALRSSRARAYSYFAASSGGAENGVTVAYGNGARALAGDNGAAAEAAALADFSEAELLAELRRRQVAKRGGGKSGQGARAHADGAPRVRDEADAFEAAKAAAAAGPACAPSGAAAAVAGA